jgi:threonine dehydrogenase-like Zn-dependent dehydrogenase
MAIGTRHVWEPQRALVVGAGAVGMLSTYLLRLEGHQVWTASREGAGSLKARLVEAAGGTYVSSASTASLLELRDDVGGFDVVVEAAGDAEVMLSTLALLRRNGVACLLGIDARERPVSIPGPVVGVDAVVQNRVVFGSVNATKADWHTAVTQLEAMRRRWPEALDAMVGLRVSPDRFEEAFAFQGVKATLRFG